jgi:protein-tyrosine phosphatase
MSAPVRVCFVCLGNICRSPTAEGVLLAQLRAAGLDHAVSVDSAGTAAYHVGERPDPRTLAAAARRGYALPSVARQFVRSDFARYSHVLAMDRQNLVALERLRGSGGGAEPTLLRSFEPDADAPDVPDPYYGGAQGFEQVLDICERACAGFLSQLRESAGLAPLRGGRG